MSVVQTADPSILFFTDSAADKVHSLISEEGNDNLKLRVFVTGGGCSGFMYNYEFITQPGEKDRVFEFDDIKTKISIKKT